MAKTESIKEAMRIAEDRACWASNTAESMLSIVPDGEGGPHWVNFHFHAVELLVEAIDGLVFAINRGEE